MLSVSVSVLFELELCVCARASMCVHMCTEIFKVELRYFTLALGDCDDPLHLTFLSVCLLGCCVLQILQRR